MPTASKQARDEARWFFAFAHPTRLAILRELAGGPRTVKGLAEALAMHQPNVTVCVREMRRAGVIVVEKDGIWTRCALANATVGKDSFTIRHPSGRAVTLSRDAPAS
jgi:DNA-binding transcriptional ArsR family regulator